jgi:spermidine/putrescine transport system substrate-binding protein
MEYDPGWKYSVASDIYFTGYSYNTKYVDDPRIPSWKVLFEPDEKNKGRITLLDNMFEVIGAALVYLGYSPFSDDEGELMEAKEVLLRLKPDVMAYDSWPKRLIMEEEAMISHMWYGDTLAIREDYEYVRGVLPSEGAVMGMDIMLIPIGSPHPATAHLWLNYLFRPEVNTLLLEGIGYSPIHTAVSKLLPEEMLEWMVPPEGYTDKCGLFDPRGYTGKGLELRAAIWEELKR